MPSLITQAPIEHFVRSRLYWFGRVARQDIVSTFGVGTAYASRLLSKMREQLKLVDVGKAVTLAINENSIPEGVSSQRFLNDLYCSALNREDPTPRCGDDVPHMTLDSFRRHVPENILRPILRSLQIQGVLEIEYIGMNIGDEVKKRIIEPLSLMHAGGRWHINAFCQAAGSRRDFVISRILSVRQIERDNQADPMFDLIQGGARTRYYSAHPLLSEKQKEVVRREFGMENSILEIALTDSESFYFEQQYVANSDNEKPPYKLLVKS